MKSIIEHLALATRLHGTPVAAVILGEKILVYMS